MSEFLRAVCTCTTRCCGEWMVSSFIFKLIFCQCLVVFFTRLTATTQSFNNGCARRKSGNSNLACYLNLSSIVFLFSKKKPFKFSILCWAIPANCLWRMYVWLVCIWKWIFPCNNLPLLEEVTMLEYFFKRPVPFYFFIGKEIRTEMGKSVLENFSMGSMIWLTTMMKKVTMIHIILMIQWMLQLRFCFLSLTKILTGIYLLCFLCINILVSSIAHYPFFLLWFWFQYVVGICLILNCCL